jgi:aryl-alcohol dehydrogenase-like predicted oxidoreductase
MTLAPVSLEHASVSLGQTGLVVPRLAMGTGTRGWERASDQTRLGRSEFVRLMRHGIERGAAFIDAADLYGSHEFSRATLAELPRERLTLLTKIWFNEAPKMQPTTTARPEVERFLGELGTDYLDIVLIHMATSPTWPLELERMRDELSQLKQAGRVRAVGCSCHTHAALKVAAEHPWVDVIFARINPGGKNMDQDASVAEVRATLVRARANGKAVIGMKVYGNGNWASPEQRRESLRTAFEDGLVDAVTIGHLSTEQFDDTSQNLASVLGGLGI